MLWYWKSCFDRSTLGFFFTDDNLNITENVNCDESDMEEIPHKPYCYSTTIRNAIQRFASIRYTLKSVQSDSERYKCDCLILRRYLIIGGQNETKAIY